VGSLASLASVAQFELLPRFYSAGSIFAVALQIGVCLKARGIFAYIHVPLGAHDARVDKRSLEINT
jgi:hypothetical protein